MENALPCPICKNDFDTGPSWTDSNRFIWWDCECGYEGPISETQEHAIMAWNKQVREYENRN